MLPFTSRFSDGRASSFTFVPLTRIGMESAYMAIFIAEFIVVNNSK